MRLGLHALLFYCKIPSQSMLCTAHTYTRDSVATMITTMYALRLARARCACVALCCRLNSRSALSSNRRRRSSPHRYDYVRVFLAWHMSASGQLVLPSCVLSSMLLLISRIWRCVHVTYTRLRTAPTQFLRKIKPGGVTTALRSPHARR